MPRAYTVSLPQGEGASRWLGIDRRNTATGANPSTVYDGLNVDLTIGGDFERRDALEEYAALPEGTHGLYSLGGYLRVAGPAGNGLSTRMPIAPSIKLDEFGEDATAAASLTKYARLRSVTNWGASAATGPQPYLALETTSGQVIHHWLNILPAAPNAPVDTLVATPFASGPDVVKLKGKLYAFDVFTGRVHYSSTQFGPSVWDEATAPGDAGFISPLEHALSEVELSGLGQHQGRLMVVYKNAMQFWNVDPDPANNAFVTAYNGPGTRQFGSLENVIGDVFYFSEGGFRSLATQTVTGELREGALGSPIEPLTAPFNSVDNSRVRAIWSQARSQYLCFFNSADGLTCDAFCFTSLPSLGVQGWTRWSLPIAVDYVTEHEGDLFVRRGDMIYRFNPDIKDDQVNSSPVEVEADVITHFLSGGAERKPKQWLMMDVEQEGTCDVSMLVDPRDRTLEEQIARGLNGTTYDIGAIPIQAFGHSIALRFKSTDLWKLDSISLDVQLLDGMG